MKLFPVLGVGLLRILQANFTKKSSTYMEKNALFMRFGVYFNFCAAVFSVIYLLFFGFRGFNFLVVICAALMAAGFLAEQLTAMSAMRKAPLALCNFCALGGGAVFSSIAGIFFFGEPMLLRQWIGVVLFFVAVWLISPKQEKKANAIGLKIIGLLLANALINGALGVVSKYYVAVEQNSNSALFSFLSYLLATVLFLACAGIMGVKDKSSAEETLVNFPKPLLICGVALGAICATLVFLNSVLATIVPLVILSTVPSVVSIIGCMFADALLFKQKITFRNVIGVACGILCAILIVNF